jgi:hypothetical protein
MVCASLDPVGVVEQKLCLFVELVSAIEPEPAEVAAANESEEYSVERARRNDDGINQRPHIDCAVDNHEDKKSVKILEIPVSDTVAGEVAVMIHDNYTVLADRAVMCPKRTRHFTPITERFLTIIIKFFPEIRKLLRLTKPRSL